MTAMAAGWSIDDFIGSMTAASAHTTSAYASDVKQFAEWVSRQKVTSPNM